MKVKELKNRYEGKFDEIEFYVDSFEHRPGFHTDRITEVDGNDEEEVIEYELMDKEDYEHSILANCGMSWADFGWDDNCKVLAVKIDKKD